MYKLDTTKYQEIEHTADIGIIVTATTVEDVFAHSAFGMLSIIYHNLPGQGPLRQNIELEEFSLSELLVSWLSELNYLLVVHHFLPAIISDLQIKETDKHYKLQAALEGDDAANHWSEIRNEIKAVTYHQLQLELNDQGYSARIIFDI
jgi:SHS2 domain-containing protein